MTPDPDPATLEAQRNATHDHVLALASVSRRGVEDLVARLEAYRALFHAEDDAERLTAVQTLQDLGEIPR